VGDGNGLGVGKPDLSLAIPRARSTLTELRKKVTDTLRRLCGGSAAGHARDGRFRVGQLW